MNQLLRFELIFKPLFDIVLFLTFNFTKQIKSHFYILHKIYFQNNNEKFYIFMINTLNENTHQRIKNYFLGFVIVSIEEM